MSTTKGQLILASSSPRRKELLERAGVSFSVIPASVDEVVLENEEAGNAALRIAEDKAKAVAAKHPESYVLAADTIVALHWETLSEDDTSTTVEKTTLFGKPACQDEAKKILKALQGRAHKVVTGFCLTCIEDSYTVSRLVETEIVFRPLSDGEIDAYISTGEPMDKAGAYAIQGRGAVLIDSIRGSYTNVIGLPVCQVLEELRSAGVWTP